MLEDEAPSIEKHQQQQEEPESHRGEGAMAHRGFKTDHRGGKLVRFCEHVSSMSSQ